MAKNLCTYTIRNLRQNEAFAIMTEMVRPKPEIPVFWLPPLLASANRDGGQPGSRSDAEGLAGGPVTWGT